MKNIKYDLIADCHKAKENRVTAHLGARQNVENKKTERERKANPVKENLIAILAETLERQDNLINIKVTKIYNSIAGIK